MKAEYLETVMSEYTNYLLRIGYYYTQDLEQSRDLVQDVFLQFYYSNYEEQGRLKAYLAKMMANRCKDYLKSWGYRKLKLMNHFMPEQLVDQKDRLMELEEKALLDEAILNLKVKLREVIFFYYLEELTTKEISMILHIPESTIKTRLQTARQKIKEQLHKSEWEVLLYE